MEEMDQASIATVPSNSTDICDFVLAGTPNNNVTYVKYARSCPGGKSGCDTIRNEP